MLGSVLRYGDVSGWLALYYRLFGVPHIGMHIKHFALGYMLRSLNTPRHILDAGCGNGLYAFWLAKMLPDTEVLAVDIDDNLIQHAMTLQSKSDLGNLRFVHADLLQSVYEDAFDMVLSVDVLEHVVQDEQMLANLFLALRPGGTIIIHVPKRHQNQHRVFGDWVPWSGRGHVRDEYTEQEIRDKVEATEFVIEELVQTFGWLAAPFWEMGTVLRLRYPALNYLCFPLLMSFCYFDHFLPYRDGNGILLRARRPDAQICHKPSLDPRRKVN